MRLFSVHSHSLSFKITESRLIVWFSATDLNIVSRVGWDPPASECLRVCVCCDADRGTVVCCFAEMMMPPCLQ